MPKKLLTFSCWLMLAVYPVSTVAADAVGMLSATGTVLVDRQPAAARGAVFPGDVIETKANSNAVVSGQGRVVSLGENSSVRVGARDLELESGAVVVSSSSGVVTRVEGATIQTAPGTQSKFLARKLNGQLQLLAIEGRVFVSDGRDSQAVPAAKGVSVTLHQDSGAGPSGATKGIGWLSNDDLGVLIVVAAAIAAGVAIGVYNAETTTAVTPPAP